MPNPYKYEPHAGNEPGGFVRKKGDKISICAARDNVAGELIAKALNALPETETEFRNERLATRRRENRSPRSETT